MIKRLLAIAATLSVATTSLAADVDYRLPSAIQPSAQAVHLRLDPSAESYAGETTITLTVHTDSDRIGVYEIGLDMADIRLTGANGSRQLTAQSGDWDIAWLSDGDTIPAGDYELSIDFTGQYSTDALGMHSVRFEDNDYLFTQMEAMYARRAFPLFDEPSFKLPYTLTISAPAELVAIANTPVASREVSGDWQTVRFEPTKPLPSYLLAWAVGPLERAPIEGISVPGYIYTPVGHADKLGFVLNETPNIVASLEDYFGSDYPFAKLDFVAVPDFAFGAMENPGLITYRTDLLLLGDEPTGGTAAQALMVIAHEVAHIWYGDVVTMEWWNDLWLNEAFASWMAWSTMQTLYPQYDPQLNLPQAGAFGPDQQSSAKPIRRPVRSEKEIFDGLGLNYTKGHAILAMLENYLGADVWQRAVRAYIKKHAWSNATEADLWAAVTEESGIDVAEIAGGYLNQPGYAFVRLNADGTVEQSRFHLPDIDVPDLDWVIPLNVKYKADGDVRQTFYLLDEKSGSIDLPSDAEWVYPDAGATGYYRWNTDLDRLYALLSDVDELSNREKIALLDNAAALFTSNQLALSDYLFVLETLLSDPYPLVFLPTMENLKNIGDNFVDAGSRPEFARFVDRTMAARFAEIGADSRPTDSEALVQMRPRLLRMLGEHGADPVAREAARDIAERFVADPSSVSVDLAREGLRVASMYDDGSLYDDYIAAYRKADTAAERSVVLQSVYFRDPEVIDRHLDFSLTDEVASGDAATGVGLYAAVLPDNTPVYDWLEENLEAFQAKIPAFYHSAMPQILGGGCSDASLARLEDFFAERGDSYATSLAKAVEGAKACIANRERHQADLERFLSNAGDEA